MPTPPVDGAARSTAGEIVGVVIIVTGVVLFLASLVVHVAGFELAVLGLMAGFALGTTGVGAHAAAREARLRREGGRTS